MNPAELSQNRHLYVRYGNLIKSAIAGPLCVKFECLLSDVVKNPEGRATIDQMINEAWEVVYGDVPGLNISIKDLHYWVDTMSHAERIQWVVVYSQLGMDTGVDNYNGWLIRRAREYGFSLPTHQEMMDIVIPKTEQNRIRLEEEKKQAKKSSGDKKEAKPYEEKADRVEMIRERKARRIKEGLGKQVMPEIYAKPQITPVGNRGN